MPNEQHLAIYVRLRMEERFAINPFDLPLGADKPWVNQKIFLVTLLGTLATEMDATAPPDGIQGLASIIVTAAYERLSRTQQPTAYERSKDHEVD